MGRLFLFTKIFSGIVIVLFFPIFISWNLHFDFKEKKYAFCLKAYKKIKVFGGYATLYDKGIALHVGKERAILLPYQELRSRRKNFPFFKTFQLLSIKANIESTAESLFALSCLDSFLNIAKKFHSEFKKINFDIWISKTENLKITAKCTLFFNCFILLMHLIEFLWEKIIKIWQEKTKKLIT